MSHLRWLETAGPIGCSATGARRRRLLRFAKSAWREFSNGLFRAGLKAQRRERLPVGRRLSSWVSGVTLTPPITSVTDDRQRARRCAHPAYADLRFRQ
ncbi:hypothetical protein KCP73_06115 [Salmonella enterica subsp. enterica]|nr:hypothetical protein KCP73_06115 [Salmonella enterica subsp. enterica]